LEIQSAEFPVWFTCNEITQNSLLFLYFYLLIQIPYINPSENLCTWCENLWLNISTGVEQILPAVGVESAPPIRGRLAAGPLDAWAWPGSDVAELGAAPSGAAVGM
jgi:hypothetical protein